MPSVDCQEQSHARVDVCVRAHVSIPPNGRGLFCLLLVRVRSLQFACVATMAYLFVVELCDQLLDALLTLLQLFLALLELLSLHRKRWCLAARHYASALEGEGQAGDRGRERGF